MVTRRSTSNEGSGFLMRNTRSLGVCNRARVLHAHPSGLGCSASDNVRTTGTAFFRHRSPIMGRTLENAHAAAALFRLKIPLQRSRCCRFPWNVMTVTPVIRFLLPAFVRARFVPSSSSSCGDASCLVDFTWPPRSLPALPTPARPATALTPISRFFRRTWEVFGRGLVGRV